MVDTRSLGRRTWIASGAALMITVMAVLAGTIWATATMSSTAVMRTADADLFSISRLVRAAIGDAIRDDPAGAAAARTVTRLRDAFRLDTLMIIDAEGLIRADASGIPAGCAADPLILAGAPAALAPEGAIQRLRRSDDEIQRLVAPIGSARLLIERRDPGAGLDGLMRTSLGLGALVAGVGLVTVLLATWLLVRRLRTADRLLAQHQRLQVAGVVAAGLAHDLRNPLASIRVATELAATRAAGQAELLPLLDGMAHDIAEADRRLDGFLDLCRDGDPQRDPVPPSELLDAVARSVAGRARAAGLDCRIGPCAEADRAAAGAGWTCDRRQVVQALVNLAVNAIEASAPGSAIELLAEAGDGELRLAVGDRGPGLPRQVRARIAHGFVTTKPGGTGLGVMLAARAAERHRGRLVLDPRDGGGTLAALLLPLHPA